MISSCLRREMSILPFGIRRYLSSLCIHPPLPTFLGHPTSWGHEVRCTAPWACRSYLHRVGGRPYLCPAPTTRFGHDEHVGLCCRSRSFSPSSSCPKVAATFPARLGVRRHRSGDGQGGGGFHMHYRIREVVHPNLDGLSCGHRPQCQRLLPRRQPATNVCTHVIPASCAAIFFSIRGIYLLDLFSFCLERFCGSRNWVYWMDWCN